MAFADDVRQHFGALAGELSLTGSAGQSRTGMPSVSYQADSIEYQVCLDARGKEVVTLVYLNQGGELLAAQLQELVVTAKLGKPQDIKTGGQTRRAISLSLASQAGWVRRLHPLLTSSAGPDLVRRSG